MDIPSRVSVPNQDVELFGRRATGPVVDVHDYFGPPDAPVYGERTLGAVLPGVAAALGVPTGLPAAT